GVGEGADGVGRPGCLLHASVTAGCVGESVDASTGRAGPQIGVIGSGCGRWSPQVGYCGALLVCCATFSAEADLVTPVGSARSLNGSHLFFLGESHVGEALVCRGHAQRAWQAVTVTVVAQVAGRPPAE